MFFRKDKRPKPRKGAWFIPLHWSYLPVTLEGYLTYIPFLLYLYVTLDFVERYTSSLNDTLIGLFPFWLGGVIVMHWFASHKS